MKYIFAKVFVILVTFFLFTSCSSLYNQNTLLKNGEEVTLHDLDITRFAEAYELLQEEYYGYEWINKEEIVDGMIAGMLEKVGDRHSEYLTLDEKKDFLDVLNGDFEWIGAVINKNDFGVEVERVLKGSPAKESGILPGDIIIQAGDIELKDLSLYEAVDKIKGSAGSQVLLSILREGNFWVIEKVVTRAHIDIPSVESEYLENKNLGYISVNMFGEDTSWEFIQELSVLEKQKISGLIIDLRDNGGGYLNEAVSLLGKLLWDNKIAVTTKGRKLLSHKNYFTFSDGDIFQKPLVVIINENSASASEIVAGALQDYEKAIIVGKKSYGKGSVQNPFDLSDTSMFKITTAHWYTPNGKSIEGEGITPDIDIEILEEDFTENENGGFDFYDRQMEEAKNILEKFIEKKSLGDTIEEVKNSL